MSHFSKHLYANGKACMTQKEELLMKKCWIWFLTVIYVAAGVAYGADRLYFTSAEGYSQGAYGLRYLILAALLLLMLPAVLSIPAGRRGCPAGAACRVFAGVLAICFTAASAAEIVFYGAGDLIHTAHAVLQLGTAAYLAWLAFWKPLGTTQLPPHSAVWGIAACASLYLLVPMRFMNHQSSLVRVGNTMQLLSALAALLFATVCLRRIYVPESACGRALCASGLSAFLLCTCQEAARLAVGEAADPEALFTSAALAVLGFAGLYAAVSCRGLVRQDQAAGQQ